jgi:hypothetical protein
LKRKRTPKAMGNDLNQRKGLVQLMKL